MKSTVDVLSGRLPLLFAVGFCAASCGGGGASGGGGSQVIVPLTTTEIQIQPNDSWTYHFAGTFTPTGGSGQSASGTMTQTCTAKSGSQITESETFTFEAGGQSHTTTKVIVYNQASDGSLQYVSVQSGTQPAQAVTSTTFTSPGTLGSGVTATGTTIYRNSAQEKDTLNVTGQTQVKTPLALFNAWVTSDTVVYNGSTISNYTQDRVPGLGHPVFTNGVSVSSAGTVKGTFTLTATTVPLPQ